MPVRTSVSMKGEPKSINYSKYYDLEQYLFNEVRSNFSKNECLSTQEFFCIIIWKANRSKSKIKSRIKRRGINLSEAVREITSKLYSEERPKDKLRYLISEWGFRLPIASAILTVLYPNEFTVYDIRVCNMLDSFHGLQHKSNFESLWKGYLEFKEAIVAKAPKELSLRDKDKYLWGKSFYEDLNAFINN